MRLLRTSVWLVATIALISVCVLFWPASLGGRTTYVSTHGTSMLPRFHSGDLAIVQTVVRVPTSARSRRTPARPCTPIVLHRIVAVHDGRFTFKGDNNDFVDPDHPTARSARRQARGAGTPRRRRTERPSPSRSCSFPCSRSCSAASSLGAATVAPQRAHDARTAAARDATLPRAHAHGAGDPRTSRCSRRARWPSSGAVLVAVGVWRMRRARETTTRARAVPQTATIGYSGAAPRGAVYPDGRLHTGDPLFTKMINARHVDLHFAFAATGPTVTRCTERRRSSPTSRAQPAGTVSSCSRRRRAFAGDRVDATARLDLRHAPAHRARLHGRNRPRHARCHVAGHVEAARLGEVDADPDRRAPTSRRRSRSRSRPSSCSRRRRRAARAN